MDENASEVKKILNNRKNLKFKLVLESAVIGILVGLIIVCNRILVSKLSYIFNYIYKLSNGSPTKILVLFLGLILLGYFVGCLLKREPMISGSGIPQVEGILIKKIEVNPLRVLIYKFIGGTVALSAGLSVGREGPSVQMGASIAQVFAKLFKRQNLEEQFLLTSGASAGLSAAFNAPLSGVMFALEEVHKNFSPLVLLSAISSSIMADFVCKEFLGLKPALVFSNVQVFPLSYYFALPLLGIVLGISGMIFNKGILKSQMLYGKLKSVPVQVKVIIPFLVTGVVGLSAPILLGGGSNLIESLADGGFTLKLLFIFLLFKFLLTLICFGSGTPGGIFFPLLVLGAIVGNIFGIAFCNFTDLPMLYVVNFIIFGMAGHFASTVKSPITGIILITEMTGSFEHLLALTIVVITAYIVSDVLNCSPIYESLLNNLLNKKNNVKESEQLKGNDRIKTLLEISVCMGSYIEEKKIKEISWPKKCLVVSIKRGDKEIIPKGNTKILNGDYLVVMVNETESGEALEKIKSLASEFNN
ncbi:ClC family H(+)/Cl(-) exchange transporter [Clostridium uliginosum]|uniref:H+/Cl-antiporter ClcA n=1 Tax=Clostridium uliginosum TaxID=119641 RepID=A0A1I1MWE6_9CLOT|nr:ClC family H(+)/Cl(-) exchange transporter [Clostridium uliginosum]SFC89485.1 H+/Cl-antiporter ClcA [Clostridium uliginosum]